MLENAGSSKLLTHIVHTVLKKNTKYITDIYLTTLFGKAVNLSMRLQAKFAWWRKFYCSNK